MQLYAGNSKQFVEDAVQNQIARKLEASFFDYYRYKPSQGEVKSWHNSLSRMCMILQHGSFDDQGVILEYQLPLSSKRLDCMVTGVGGDSRANSVIVELKQWDDALPSDTEDCVRTYVGRGLRDVLHPSRQVGNYEEYLRDSHTVFEQGEVGLASCAYLHNLFVAKEHELFKPRFESLLASYPLFTGDQAPSLIEYLSGFVGKGDGMDVLAKVVESKHRPGKRLLDHTSAVIKGQKSYVLLDEQQVVFNKVLAVAREGFHRPGKAVVLVHGGPGTGKSVIALHLVAELSALGYHAPHATGSKSFTENLRKIVGRRAGIQFNYFANYARVERNSIDVLILDEAHRLWASPNTRFTKAADRSDRPLIDHLIEAAKASVYFIDDLQVVRPNEVGSSALIRDAAVRAGATLYEFELEAQFRCNGSDGFVNWVDNTLGIRRTANVLWDPSDAFDFRIVDDPAELERAIRTKQAEGSSARLMAGFCWEWSTPNGDGTLVPDVVIGDWAMPWNAKPDSVQLAPRIPKSHYWASDPNGIDQVGCIYTAQGFEFDYAGVIFGRDLRYDAKAAAWVADASASRDRDVKRSGERLLDLLKNTYRVLLTRGLRGCYVHFVDADTRNFFRSRME
jgi:DUF2075 family protein